MVSGQMVTGNQATLQEEKAKLEAELKILLQEEIEERNEIVSALSELAALEREVEGCRGGAGQARLRAHSLRALHTRTQQHTIPHLNREVEHGLDSMSWGSLEKGKKGSGVLEDNQVAIARAAWLALQHRTQLQHPHLHLHQVGESVSGASGGCVPLASDTLVGSLCALADQQAKQLQQELHNPPPPPPPPTPPSPTQNTQPYHEEEEDVEALIRRMQNAHVEQCMETQHLNQQAQAIQVQIDALLLDSKLSSATIQAAHAGGSEAALATLEREVNRLEMVCQERADRERELREERRKLKETDKIRDAMDNLRVQLIHCNIRAVQDRSRKAAVNREVVLHELGPLSRALQSECTKAQEYVGKELSAFCALPLIRLHPHSLSSDVRDICWLSGNQVQQVSSTLLTSTLSVFPSCVSADQFLLLLLDLYKAASQDSCLLQGVRAPEKDRCTVDLKAAAQLLQQLHQQERDCCTATLPSIQAALKLTAACGEKSDQVQKAMDEWWSQEGFHSVPWVRVGGKTLSQYIKHIQMNHATSLEMAMKRFS